MKTCFSIMPFKGFDDIDRIIEQAAADCGLRYMRGDRRLQPGTVLPRILRDIQEAAVIVADITGQNPNVFYELGIAHHVKGPDRVVVITQDVERSPYDVHQFNQLLYAHSELGRAELRKRLPEALRAAADGDDFEAWKVIRGRLPRTREMIRDLRLLVDDSGPKRLKGVTIRVVAGLSSLSISEHEPSDPGVDAEYFEHLVAERDALRNALLAGACLKAVLNPPRRFAQAMLPDRLRVRYRRLLGLLEGRSDIIGDPAKADADVRAMRQCEFVLSPVPMPNLFIIDERVAYEGMKRAGTGGFEMTHCETGARELHELIEQFDRFFEGSRRDMIRTHPPDGRLVEVLREFLDEAMAASAGE
jgi:hypothetical protein